MPSTASSSVVEEAERYKNEANELFKGVVSQTERGDGTRPIGPLQIANPTSAPALRVAAKHYVAAVDGYTKAIELRPDCAIYFSNRAIAHAKLEEYGSAIADATESLQLDPNYVKVCVALGGTHRGPHAAAPVGTSTTVATTLLSAPARCIPPRAPALRDTTGVATRTSHWGDSKRR